jgi:hypothetical protein
MEELTVRGVKALQDMKTDIDKTKMSKVMKANLKLNLYYIDSYIEKLNQTNDATTAVF